MGGLPPGRASTGFQPAFHRAGFGWQRQISCLRRASSGMALAGFRTTRARGDRRVGSCAFFIASGTVPLTGMASSLGGCYPGHYVTEDTPLSSSAHDTLDPKQVDPMIRNGAAGFVVTFFSREWDYGCSLRDRLVMGQR